MGHPQRQNSEAVGPQIAVLDRIACPPPGQFKSTLEARDTPALITGVMDSWPALQRWTPDEIARRYGDLEFLTTLHTPTTGRPYEKVAQNFRRAMTLGAFVDHMRSTDLPCYIRRQIISKWDGATADFDFESLFPHDPQDKRAYVWFGANTLTPMHFDMSNGILCQLYGTKRIYAVSPADSARLYPYAHSCTKSPVLPSAPDLQSFPDYADVTLYEGRLNRGEVLFLPTGWWHSIVAEGPSVSVSREFDQNMRWSDVWRALSAGGSAAWRATARDFVWHGLLKRPYQRMLFDDPPMGVLLYDVVAGGVSRRLRRGV